jgi:hypothetical protein
MAQKGIDSIQYLFNSQGNWIATVVDQNIFSLEHKWLGWLQKGYWIVWTPDEQYLGSIMLGKRFLFVEYYLPLLPISFASPTPVTVDFPDYLGNWLPPIELPPGVKDVQIL